MTVSYCESHCWRDKDLVLNRHYYSVWSFLIFPINNWYLCHVAWADFSWLDTIYIVFLPDWYIRGLPAWERSFKRGCQSRAAQAAAAALSAHFMLPETRRYTEQLAAGTQSQAHSVSTRRWWGAFSSGRDVCFQWRQFTTTQIIYAIYGHCVYSPF